MIEETLQGVRFFEFLTEEEREEFAEVSEFVSFGPGENIIEEGAEQESLFVLASGTVEVRKGLPGGRSRLLAEIDTSHGRTVVGERGLLGESGASATVRAVGEVEAIRIPRETFRRMVAEGRPAAFKLSYRIARTLARRLTRLDEEVVEAIRAREQGRDRYGGLPRQADNGLVRVEENQFMRETPDLKDVPIFEHLDDDERAELEELLEPVSFKAGQRIFEEGAPEERLFVITSGTVEVYKGLAPGRRQLLARIEAPTVIGEMGLLTEPRATASVEALTRVEAHGVGRDRLLEMLDADSPAACKLIYEIGRTLA